MFFRRTNHVCVGENYIELIVSVGCGWFLKALEFQLMVVLSNCQRIQGVGLRGVGGVGGI